MGTECCLDKNKNNICDSDDLISEQIDNEKELSASQIYNEAKDSMFIVETTCDYNFKYEDFDIFSGWDEYDYFEINLEPNSDYVEIEDYAVFSGSGFLMGSGIYTNSHVINCDAEYQEEFAKYAYSSLIDYYNTGYVLTEEDLGGVINFDIDKMVNDINNDVRYESDITKEDIETYLIVSIAEHLSYHLSISETGKKVEAYHRSDQFTNPISLNLAKKGKDFPGRDYAIFKSDTDKQSLNYAKKPNLEIGESVYVIGFPLIQLDESEDLYEIEVKREDPIITSGILSSVKISDSGVKYYVIDAAAYFGSSGGPVFNSKGEVIGILTAGVTEGGINFMLPLSELE